MYCQYHVTGFVGDDGVGVGGRVVEELAHSFESVLGGCGLVRRDCTERCEHGGIHCSRLVQEGADDLLDVSFLLWGQEAGSVCGLGVLFCLSVSRYFVLVRQILWVRWGFMLETV